MKSFILLLSAALLVSCAASDQAESALQTLPDETPSQEAIIEEFEKSPGNCSAMTEKNFQRILELQMDAFSQKDFAAAYELTSERFKSGFSLTRFTQVISEFYPSLLDNTDFIGTKCLEMGFTGFYEIDVKSLSKDIRLRYRFEYVEDTWFIAGAEEMQEDTSEVPA